jgi:hypothetical protein
MTNEYCMGMIEVVYNPNGHTYWIEGLIDDKEIKFHHTTSMHEDWTLEKALMEEVKKFNDDYHIILRDLVYGNKNKYLYEVVW